MLKRGDKVRFSDSYLQFCGTQQHIKDRGVITSVMKGPRLTVIYGVRWNGNKKISRHLDINIERDNDVLNKTKA